MQACHNEVGLTGMDFFTVTRSVLLTVQSPHSRIFVTPQTIPKYFFTAIPIRHTVLSLPAGGHGGELRARPHAVQQVTAYLRRRLHRRWSGAAAAAAPRPPH